MTRLQQTNSEKTIRKIDIAQVSLSLQDRLGLAKVKYQNGRLHPLETIQNGPRHISLGSDKPSDSSSEISHSRCETPMTSPPLRTATYSKELPRSSRNRHAATFNSRVMQPMLSASRKRVRSDSTTDRPIKTPRASWKSSYHLPASSPGFHRCHGQKHQSLPFVAETSPEFSPPAYHPHSDNDNDPDLPVHSFRNVSSMVRSSPPRTPPPKHARLPRHDPSLRHEDGADLLLYLANSPTPGRIAGRAQTRDLAPSTPPSQYAFLTALTPTPGGGVFPNFGTPNQPFNFADFVNITPSPAQPTRSGRTPGGPLRTPLANRDGRKRPNLDTLLPPSAESPKNGSQESGLALQLGGELRP